MFIARYSDLFTSFHSVYNTVMKIVYIAASSWIVYMIRREKPFVATYEVRERHGCTMDTTRAHPCRRPPLCYLQSIAHRHRRQHRYLSF